MNDAPVCKLIAKGETENAIKLIKELNKHAEEHKKLMGQLSFALEEATKKDTKVTLSIFVWYEFLSDKQSFIYLFH